MSSHLYFRIDWRLATALLFGAAPTPAIAGQADVPATEAAVITPDRLLRDYAPERSAVPVASWLPDARHIIVALPGTTGSNAATWIERIDTMTGRRERLVEGESPRAAPDGSAVAYLVKIENGFSLAVHELGTGRSRTMATLPEGYLGQTLSFAWSADSRRIAYSLRPARRRPVAAAGDQPQSSVRVVGAAGDIPEPSELWIADVATGSTRKIFSRVGTLADVSWTPDGQALLVSSTRTFEYRNDDGEGVVLKISVATGEATTLVKDMGVQDLAPVVSPSGRSLAFKLDRNNRVYPFYWNVATMPIDGGEPRQLTRDLFVAFSDLVWAPDEKQIYFACRHAAFSQICAVSDGGAVRTITTAPRNVSGFSLSRSGGKLVWTARDALGRTEIRIADADGTHEKVVLDLNPEIAALKLGAVEEVRWRSRDGLGIVGLLVKPVNYRPGKRYPMIVDVHGGPVGGVFLSGSLLCTSPLEWQMWAAKGYAVFVPDYRDSEIAGWDPILRMREAQDYNERNTDDILSGIDAIIARGIADPDRLALIGHSNGSTMTNWIVTQTNRFKAAISYEGWVENYITYGASLRVGGNSNVDWRYKGKPWEVPENYERTSAVARVKGVRTPTMFIAGDYGGESGVENLFSHEFMFTAWKRQGVPTELLIYGGEGHVISRPENQRDLLTRAIEWIDRWLSAGKLDGRLRK